MGIKKKVGKIKKALLGWNNNIKFSSNFDDFRSFGQTIFYYTIKSPAYEKPLGLFYRLDSVVFFIHWTLHPQMHPGKIYHIKIILEYIFKSDMFLPTSKIFSSNGKIIING